MMMTDEWVKNLTRKRRIKKEGKVGRRWDEMAAIVSSGTTIFPGQWFYSGRRWRQNVFM